MSGNARGLLAPDEVGAVAGVTLWGELVRAIGWPGQFDLAIGGQGRRHVVYRDPGTSRGGTAGTGAAAGQDR